MTVCGFSSAASSQQRLCCASAAVYPLRGRQKTYRPAPMQRRTQAIRRNGQAAEIEVFKGLPHGFGLGEGTAAEGWLNRAADFWIAQR